MKRRSSLRSAVRSATVPSLPGFPISVNSYPLSRVSRPSCSLHLQGSQRSLCFYDSVTPCLAVASSIFFVWSCPCFTANFLRMSPRYLFFPPQFFTPSSSLPRSRLNSRSICGFFNVSPPVEPPNRHFSPPRLVEPFWLRAEPSFPQARDLANPPRFQANLFGTIVGHPASSPSPLPPLRFANNHIFFPLQLFLHPPPLRLRDRRGFSSCSPGRVLEPIPRASPSHLFQTCAFSAGVHRGFI